MKPGDRFLKIVEWSDEDRCYVGSCPGLMLGGVHGANETAVYRELCRVVDEWVRIQEEDGEPLPKATASRKFSGKIVVRLGPDLHKEIAIEAVRAGESLNSRILRILRARPRSCTKRRARRPA